MSLPQIFNFNNHEVRTIQKDGEVWFIAKDVADILGYVNPRKAVSDHCKSAVSDGVTIRDAIGREQEMTIIPERDVYRLTMKSKLPGAEKFEEWVVGDVLPQIRKTGGYAPQTPELQIAHAILLAGKMIEEQKQVIAELTPKAEFYDAVTGSHDTIDIGLAAKVLNMGVGRNNLFELLRGKKILQDDNQPFQKFVDRGYFRVIESKFNKPDGSTHINCKTVVFQKGLAYIRKVLSSDGYGQRQAV